MVDGVKFLLLHPTEKVPSTEGQRRQEHGTVRKRSSRPDRRRNNVGFWYISTLEQSMTTFETRLHNNPLRFPIQEVAF